MSHNVKKLWYAAFILFMLFFSGTSVAEFEDITVMTLGVVEGRAVIKTGEGKVAVVRPGDTLPGSTAVVKQILSNRLVVTNLTATESPRRQTVWIFKAKGGKSRVQVLDSKGPDSPVRVFQAVDEVKKQ